MGAVLGQFRQERIHKKMFFFFTVSQVVLNPDLITPGPDMTCQMLRGLAAILFEYTGDS
jgi:hypothetical protein